jgi:lipopolysaccharide/colanic/teichoic acid biosynthesis glycosyltransferase
MIAKRVFDVVMAALALVLLSPLLVMLALAVRLDSAGPVLFRQERVGRHGRPFNILKFRSMRSGPGPLVTAGGDPRITRTGRLLRASKLDELPQLWNVLCGDMSLVGPRPEVPRFVAVYPADVRDRVLAVRPGITDPAAIRFRDEEAMLAAVVDPERHYVEYILPAKLAAYEEYVRSRCFAGDLRVIVATIRALFRGARRDAGHAPAGSPSPVRRSS